MMESNNADRPAKKKIAKSDIVAFGILFTDFVATMYTLYLCRLAIVNAFSGALPYLTTLIGALQVCTGVVLSFYFENRKAQNTVGGITYESVMKEIERDC